MKINYSFKSHFAKKTYIYLLGVGFISLGVSLGVLLKTKLKPYEAFYVYVSAATNNIDKDKLQDEFKPYFTDKIKEFKTYNESSIGNVYSTAGVNCDLLIVKESLLSSISFNNLLELPSKFTNSNNYVVNDKQYGFMLYDGENGKIGNAIKCDSEKYYAFVNANSVHTIDFKEKGTTNIISAYLEANK